MPVQIEADEDRAIELEDLVEFMFEEHIDPTDHESLASAAPMLRRLSNNRTFLGELVCKELEDFTSLQSSNSYSAQVFILKFEQRPKQNFFLRACFWPSMEDHAVKTSGTSPFFYHHPHDHNFNFLTVGYHGPGYGSDYYEYDYDACDGYAGEKVDLRFIERSALHQGRILLYRAFTDVHDQLPADSFSVSINIMENSVRASLMDQYSFDTAKGEITGLINRTSAVSLFNAAAALGTKEQRDLLLCIAREHPLDRVRAAALDALANAAFNKEESLRIWESVSPRDSKFLRCWRKLRTSQIESLL